MALSITKVTGVSDEVMGASRRHVRTVTITATPGAGGDTITPAQVGLKRIDEVIAHGAFIATGGGASAVVPSWNYATGKLQFYEGGAAVDTPLDEADGTPSLANFTGRLTFIGPRPA